MVCHADGNMPDKLPPSLLWMVRIVSGNLFHIHLLLQMNQTSAELITPKLFIEVVFCNDLLILMVFQTYML